MSKYPRVLLIVLTIAGLFPAEALRAKSYSIDSTATFEKAMESAKPGDSIIIADGRYENWIISLDADGTQEQPIVVQPQTPGEVIFTGISKFSITGNYIHLQDLLFNHCKMENMSIVEFNGTAHSRVRNLTFQHCEGNRPVVRFIKGANHNLLRKCHFIDIAGRSVHVNVGDEIEEFGVPAHNTIQDNVFQDIPPLGENGRETVKLGQSQPTYGHIKTYTLVEGNTFLRANGEAEIISNKCSNNTFRRNTFIDCEGELVMRGGSFCLIEGNYFSNCKGGIRLSGTHHTVKDNVVINSGRTGIRLQYGMTKEQGGHYQAVSQCSISNNTIINAEYFGILIGDSRSNEPGEKGKQNIAPENNHIFDNLIISPSENHIFADQAPDNLVQNNSLLKNQEQTKP